VEKKDASRISVLRSRNAQLHEQESGVSGRMGAELWEFKLGVESLTSPNAAIFTTLAIAFAECHAPSARSDSKAVWTMSARATKVNKTQTKHTRAHTRAHVHRHVCLHVHTYART